MRKLLSFFWLLIPVLAFSQQKNVINVLRVFPKIDKRAAFEKALSAHAKKYHTGDFKWRIAEIESGPDAGGYSIVEGPMSWDQVDTRGDLGTEHMNDWDKVTAFLTDKYMSSYLVYREEFSTVPLTDYSDKYMVTHVFPKSGMGPSVEEDLKKLKAVWTAGSETVAVYQASSSGPNQFIVVTRYKQGLKEREIGFRKPLKERYEATHGGGSYALRLESNQKTSDLVWSELLFTRMDLGSK